ncbi:MAG: hypothetical protein HY852_17250 [Bradyrhizobium sp.]|uniref:hypothetical protein n=1 Tax=Bradyrhizobium sp. TaxID=376 RepID=UPI0025C49EF5|nr:hypothetical protein [Bradyrhizobium sp.]MBI5263557.1 hypothetical protein [Bradyrhizobium sp.]
MISFQRARTTRAGKRASRSGCTNPGADEFDSYLMRLRSQLEDIRHLVLFLDLNIQHARLVLETADPSGRQKLEAQMDDIDRVVHQLRGRIFSLRIRDEGAEHERR